MALNMEKESRMVRPAGSARPLPEHVPLARIFVMLRTWSSLGRTPTTPLPSKNSEFN